MPRELQGVIVKKSSAGYEVALENSIKRIIKINKEYKTGQSVWATINYTRMELINIRKR